MANNVMARIVVSDFIIIFVSDGRLDRSLEVLDFSRTCRCYRLPQLEDTAAYNLVVDLDVYAIGANSKRARVQVVSVLTAVDPKV